MTDPTFRKSGAARKYAWSTLDCSVAPCTSSLRNSNGLLADCQPSACSSPSAEVSWCPSEQMPQMREVMIAASWKLRPFKQRLEVPRRLDDVELRLVQHAVPHVDDDLPCPSTRVRCLTLISRSLLMP